MADGQHHLGIAKEELKSLFFGKDLKEIGMDMAKVGMIGPLEYAAYYPKDEEK